MLKLHNMVTDKLLNQNICVHFMREKKKKIYRRMALTQDIEVELATDVPPLQIDNEKDLTEKVKQIKI